MKYIIFIPHFLLTLILFSCATRGEIKRFKLQLDYLEQSNAEIQKRLSRIDSIQTEQAQLISRLVVISNENMRTIQDELLLVRNALQESGYRAEQLTKKIETVSAELSRSHAYLPDSSDTIRSKQEQGESEYRQAFVEQTRGNYSVAIEKYEAFIDKYKGSPYIDDVYYQLGECYYAIGEYQKAIGRYLKLVELFPQSSYAPPALYKAGLSYREIGKNVSAKNIFNRLIKEYPGSNEAKLAKERLKSLGGR